MNFQGMYQEKVVSADEAASIVKSGDWVDYGWAATSPVAFDAALAKRLTDLTNVNFRGGILMWSPQIFKIVNPAEHMTWNSWHMGGIERKAIEYGFCYYNPMRYSELPRYYRENIHPAYVVVMQVTPMDQFGWFNFGPSVSHLCAICENARNVIVEVNNNIPRCFGGVENEIHISQVDMVIEGDNPPMAQLNTAKTTETDRAVAKLIVEEIPNGACLQLGIGGMPNAVGSMIVDSDLKDLGIHTEMYVDAFVDIALAGKVNGTKKQVDRGRQTYSFAAGTQKLYNYLNDNPECMAAPVNYTNDVRVISSINDFISVNNAVDVDLYGQINAESSGTKHISGAGGQLDFVLGAYLSNGGKSFICCSSTYTDKDGTLVSRIRPTLATGSVVTDTRTNLHWLVTEYGKANLKGLSTWQRAEAIINIAHPNFREQLIRDAEEMHIWRRSNRI